MPNFAEAYNNLGTVYLCLNEYDQALKQFNKVSTISPDYFPMLYVNTGIAYEGKKDYLKAIEYYKTSY